MKERLLASRERRRDGARQPARAERRPRGGKALASNPALAFALADHAMPYMEWAKTVMEGGLRGVIDAGSSGIAPVTMRELGVRLSDLALDGPHGYSASASLHARIARCVGTDTGRVMPALGASHALFLVCAALLSSGDEVIVETPAYEALSLVPRVFGARVVPLPRRFSDGFQFDPQVLRRLVTRKTRMVLVTNLHNPSGVALSEESLAALASLVGGEVPARDVDRGTRAGVRRDATRADDARAGRAIPEGRPGSAPSASGRARLAGRDPATPGSAGHLPKGPWVVVNEVYRDFVFRDPPPAGHTLGPRGVSLSSLTKVYGLGYTRVGWIVGDPALVHRASRVNDFGVVNAPYIADSIGAFALARRARLLARTRTILSANRKVFARFVEQAGGRLELVPPAGGTIALPRVRGLRDGRAFVERAIREHGVCVVPGEFFGAPGHLRVGIGARRPQTLKEGLRRLSRALDSITDA